MWACLVFRSSKSKSLLGGEIPGQCSHGWPMRFLTAECVFLQTDVESFIAEEIGARVNLSGRLRARQVFVAVYMFTQMIASKVNFLNAAA